MLRKSILLMDTFVNWVSMGVRIDEDAKALIKTKIIKNYSIQNNKIIKKRLGLASTYVI